MSKDFASRPHLHNGINSETSGGNVGLLNWSNANKVENKDYFAASEGVDVIYLKAKPLEKKTLTLGSIRKRDPLR